MKKVFSALVAVFLTSTLVHAQADHKLDAATLANDKIIAKEILKPTLDNAQAQNQEPDWKVLRTTITTRFDASYADRSITKAHIYYFYGRDWTQFSTALVQYTQQYEWRDSLSLLNKNAQMILEHSQNPADWKAAQAWSLHATDKDPSNEAYRKTYDGLSAKINGQ